MDGAEGPSGIAERGVVAAGHPLTAQAGARVLREGGNAVDAALAAMLTSFVAEPLLNGLGAGGFMLVHPAGGRSVLLDFFVAAPGRDAEGREPAPLLPADVHFSADAVQRFNIGPSSCGVYGNPLGLARALEMFGSLPLSDLAAPAARAGAVRIVVDHRPAKARRLAEPDVPWDHRVEDQRREVPANLGLHILGELRSRVVHRAEHPRHRKPRVQLALDQRQRVEQAGEPL